jgi:hypothetical protein
MDSLSVSHSNLNPSPSDVESVLQVGEEELEDSESAFGISKGRKRTAVSTWEHARPPKDNEEEFIGKTRYFYCKYCETPPYRCQSSSAFRNHLRSKHGIDVQPKESKVQTSALAKLKLMYSKAGGSNNAVSEFEAQVLKNVLNKSVIEKTLTTMIVELNLPFRMVEAPIFHTFCHCLNPQVNHQITTSHSEVGRKIEDMWCTEKDIVRKKLQSSLSRIHISLDIWTSPNKILFLGICAHFIECETEKLFKALLGLCPVGSHGAKDQFDVLIPLLEDYGITRKLGCIMGDNHGANDKLCRFISNFLFEKEKIAWDPLHHRMRCNGHIINLAVQAFLFGKPSGDEISENYDENGVSDDDGDDEDDGDGDEDDGDGDEDGGDGDEEGGDGDEDDDNDEDRDNNYTNPAVQGTRPLEKLHNIVHHTRKSASRYQEFKTLAGRLVPLDNSTRWNSWYLMLKVALTKEEAVDSYTKKWYNDLEKSFLTPEDWAKLRSIADFLLPFHRATLDSEGDNSTIDCVLVVMDILIKHFEQSLVSYISSAH